MISGATNRHGDGAQVFGHSADVCPQALLKVVGDKSAASAVPKTMCTRLQMMECMNRAYGRGRAGRNRFHPRVPEMESAVAHSRDSGQLGARLPRTHVRGYVLGARYAGFRVRIESHTVTITNKNETPAKAAGAPGNGVSLRAPAG